jgi:hypothetical protein
MPSYTRAVWEAFLSILSINFIPLEFDLFSDATNKVKGKHIFVTLIFITLIILLVIYFI